MSRPADRPTIDARPRRLVGWAALPAIVMTAAITTGCQSPETTPAYGRDDPWPSSFNDPQITVLAPDLREVLGFQRPIVEVNGDRPMQVQVPVRNLTEQRYLVDYRFFFYDRRGMQLDSASGWQMTALEPKQRIDLTSGALSTDASDWRLEVKWAK